MSRVRSLLRVRGVVCTTVKRRLARFLFHINCEDPGTVCLCDLHCGKADPAGSDDNHEVSLFRLTEGHDRAVGGSAAVCERRCGRDIQVWRQRENRGLLCNDELRVAARSVEAESRPVLAEVGPHATALPAPPARLLEMYADEVANSCRIDIGADLGDSSGNLMAGDERRAFARRDLIEEVEVRAADTPRQTLHEKVFRPGLRVRDLNELDRAVRLELNGAHGGR